MTESLEKRQRRRRVAAAWAAIAFVCVAALAATQGLRPSSFQTGEIVAAVVLSAALVWSTLHSTLQPTRLVHDLTTPLIAIAAISYGGSAPFVLMTQIALAELIASRVQRHTVARGVTVLGQTCLTTSLLIIGFSAATAGPQSLVTIGGAVALAVAVNYGSVLATVRYVHGDVAMMRQGALLKNGVDWSVASLSAAVVWALPSSGWALTTGAMIASTYLIVMEQRRTEHVAALTLELQARIVSAEGRTSMTGHTERVVATARRMLKVLGHDAKDSAFIEAAAWLHSLTFGGLPHRCNGRPRDSALETYANSLSSVRSIRRLLTGNGFPAPSAEPPVHVIAAACAWDSRLLAASPIETPADVVSAFGVDPTIAEALESAV